MNPSPSYYREFQGYTLGLLVAVVCTGGVYAFGKRVLAPLVLRGLPLAEREEHLERFNSTCLARVLLLLYLVYPGVSVAIFAVFSCTRLEDGTAYLDADARIVCYDRQHWRYIGGAIVWLFVVPAGIPAFFLWLLYRFKVPQAAALMADNAWLRECVKMAWQEHMEQPEGAKDVTYDTISTPHLAALVAFFLHDMSADEAAEIWAGKRAPVTAADVADTKKGADGADSGGALAAVRSGTASAKALLDRVLGHVAGRRRAESKRLTLAKRAASIAHNDGEEAARERRSFLLASLLCHCRSAGEVALPSLTWDPVEGWEAEALAAPPAPDATPHPAGVRCAELVEVIETARREVSFLFAAYRTDAWYWEVTELVRKLALTSILALIAPGSAGQVVVGLLLAFVTLIATMHVRPYAHATLNMVGQGAQLNLFLLLLVALLLKLDVDGQGDARFFSGIVSALCVVPVALPLAIRLYLRFVGGGLEARALVKDAAW